MAINFPTSLDILTNPETTNQLNSPSHAGQHSDANDAIETLEAKVGANNSAVTTSHDYKLSTVTDSNKAETQANKENTTLDTSTIKYPTNRLVKEYTDSKVADAINDGTTTIAPSQNAVFDALALKSPLASPTFTGIVTTPAIKITTGASLGKVLTSDADGDATWETVTVPVKASGAELDTGTDDAKFATAKALKDSHNVPSVVPGTSGNVLTSNGTDWTSAAPSGGGTAMTSLIPKPDLHYDLTAQGSALAANTAMKVAAYIVPYYITVNKFTFRTTSFTSGTIKVAMFSEDGQTKLFEKASGTLTSGTVTTLTLDAPVTLSPGIYYIAYLGVGTVNFGVSCWKDSTTDAYNYFNTVTGESIKEGTITVTADTVPDTITPTAITAANNTALMVRLD